ncbi:YciI family protein [Acinetobacter radioresistens]|uniref:YciI family protein n=1 Tax=Acinetobacter radioresistens TaxID=40216 RepID=UPI00124F8CA2|nr:YciI family protein [Acinetobacter radioresistens]
MPLFVLSCTDHEGIVEKRLATRPQHIERLQKLNDEGRLIVAGAMPKDPADPQAGFYGSTMIVEFDSREALDVWLKEEPFLKAGVYAHIDVKLFNKAFPQG